VNYGPNPAEVIEFGFDEDPRCSTRFRAMAEETGRYTRAAITEEQREYLRNLPLKATVRGQGMQFLMCHATPSDPLFEYRREKSPLWLAHDVGSGVKIDLVGHTHIPFRRFLETRLVVNPGSVGQPKHGRAEACYAIGQDGKVSLGSAPYDVERTVAKLRSILLSAAVFEDLALVLRNGSVPAAPSGSSDRYGGVVEIQIAPPAFLDRRACRVHVLPSLHFDQFALQFFVDRKKMLDLREDVGRDIAEIANLLISWAAVGNREDLVVVFRFLEHVQHTDGPHSDQTPRKNSPPPPVRARRLVRRPPQLCPE
jgi:diadenosine tetraphosphatase ApaH/serine/threonine PP2A family protein phosphatase